MKPEEIHPKKDLYDWRDADPRHRHQSHLFGVWSPVKKKAPFVCIEPWYGRSDRADFDQQLEHREHGNVLDPGGEFEAEYLITV